MKFYLLKIIISNKVRVRNGFTIVECILLTLVLGVSIWAILSSAMGISRLGTFSREELKAHSVTTGLFETLEAMHPASFDVDFAGTVQKAISNMGGNGNFLRGYRVLVDNIASGNGVRLVQVTLSTPPGSKKAPFVARKSLSSLSEKTVDDAIDIMEKP